MSKVTSPSSQISPSAISPAPSNIKVARDSVSPLRSVTDYTIAGVVDESNVSINQYSSEESDDSDHTSEISPLITSSTSNPEPSKLVRRGNGQKPLRSPDTVRCDCHGQPKPADKASRNRLIIACIVVLIFMIGEVVGSFYNKTGQGIVDTTQ